MPTENFTAYVLLVGHLDIASLLLKKKKNQKLSSCQE